MKLGRLWIRFAGGWAGSIALLLALAACHGQDKPACPPVKFGGEQDVLPYATGGYYGSGFIAHGDWKFRYVVARTNVPSFLVSDGFRNKRIDAYALLADKFFGPARKEQEGFWIGGGAEYWRNRIRASGSPTPAYYQNYLATVGGGYVLPLWRHVYLNPWVGAHFVLAHARVIRVVQTVYSQPLATPEASVKIGIRF